MFPGYNLRKEDGKEKSLPAPFWDMEVAIKNPNFDISMI